MNLFVGKNGAVRFSTSKCCQHNLYTECSMIT